MSCDMIEGVFNVPREWLFKAGGLIAATVFLLGCAATPVPPIEPAFAGTGREGYRVVIYVPNQSLPVVREAAGPKLEKACPEGFEIVHVSKRQQVRTIPGNLVLNVVAACSRG